MPRPLPRRVSSSLPPPPRRAYAPSLDEAEAADYFQDRGRRSSHAGHGYDESYSPRQRAESAHHDRGGRDRYRPSSRDSTHRASRHTSSSRYRDDEDRGRARSRPTQSLDRHHRRGYASRASSRSSRSSSPSSSRSSSADSSLSSHHHYGGGGHRHRRKSTAASPKPPRHDKNSKYYPPSASRTSRSTAPPKRGPLNRLRSLSLPAVASKLTGSHSRSSSHSRSPSPSKNPLHNLSHLKDHIKSPRDLPPEKRSSKEVFLRAAQCAAEAGAIAALKLRDDPSPWIGPNGKAPKVAAAALSAAAVDTFMEQRHPNRKGGIRHTVMRQVTQMAIGNLVKHAPPVKAGDGVKPGVKPGGRVKGGGKGGGKRR